MKRILFFTLAAATLLLFSCSKDSSVKPGNGSSETVKNSVTISVDIPKEGLSTKISFAEDSDKRLTKIAWEDDDVIDVYDGTTHIPFTIASISADGKTATFTGNEPAVASSYVITYNSLGSNLNTQLQNGDGTTGHLGYKVVKTVSDYKTVSFSGATIQSSVLQLRALLPDAIKNNVAKVIFKSNLAVFNEQKELTVALADGTLDANDRLDVYASIPEGDVTLSDDMELLIQFQVRRGEDTHPYDKYTAYRTFTSGTKLFKSGGSQYIGINCSNILSFANASDASIGSATNPYLVGDQNQMQKINDEMAAGETKYFKLVDDIDMTGVNWASMNPDTPYDLLVDFDGNNKTVSNLGGSLFYVFKGSICNLTLDHSTVTTGSQRGFLAQYIQGTGHVITNVDVSNGSMNSASSNAGGLVGRINSGSSGVTSATITDCDVTNTVVKGACAGGLLGSVEAKVIVSNCSYSGNTVTGTTQKIGGFLGIINDNIGCAITGCCVEDATVDASSISGDARAGGFIGQLGEGSEVKGCVVGTPSKKILVKAGSYNTETSKSVNTGGFVGVNYGIITKDESSNRSKAYVQVTSTNTTGNQLNLGGFAGFQRGTISYSDAIVSMGDLKGQYIGGFCGYIVFQTGKTVITDNCTVVGDGDAETVDIRGNNYTGGFVGVAESGAFTISNCQVLEGTVVVGQSTAGGFAAQIKSGTVEDCTAHVDMKCRGGNDGGFVGAITGGSVQRCSSSGTLSQIENTNTVFGGFAGYVNSVDLTKCSSTVNITVARSSVGGLVGDFQTANTISECFYNGTISGPANTKGGLVGTTQAVAAVITDCYTAGELVASSGTQIYGGIVGELKAGGSVTNCYSTMDMTHGGRAMGGIVGRACSGGWPVSNESNNTISKCIAWNPAITYDGTASTSASSGAIVGYTSFKNILNNCYRRYDMAYKNSNSAVGTTCQTSMVDQIDCDGTNWAINGNRPAGGTPAGTSADAQYQAPYYGIAAASTATVSSLAQTLGWSSDVWDFTGDLPTLK